MKTKALSCLGCGAVLAAAVFMPVVALAQSDEMPSSGISAGVLAILGILALAGYIYVSLAIQTIAGKTNTPNGWLAWIPIANYYLWVTIAQKPIWWFILFLIPLVNIVIMIIVWMGIAERRGKPSWWGIMLIVPLVGLIVPGYLAWAD